MEKSQSIAHSLDKDNVLGSLFQLIIADLKNGTPLWDDLVSKATKLHSYLKSTIQAIASFLETFQKLADLATNARGATKDIGTTLTRICLRQKAVEARLKSFTNSLMDCLVLPLQDKLEDWKRTVFNLDKEYAKEYKRARNELKKSSTDTLRLQKKAKKDGRNRRFDLQKRVECSLRDVDDRRKLLEDIEKQAVRSALIEERSRFCLFVNYVKPVMDEEISMLTELSHLQEVVDQLQKHTADPFSLPAASEQVIADLKLSDNFFWQLQSPPTSPSSLGSRKSSICSINSFNSSSSNGSKSPTHFNPWNKSLFLQPHNLLYRAVPSMSSYDSGFNSQYDFSMHKTCYQQGNGQQQQQQQQQQQLDVAKTNDNTNSEPSANGCWPNSQETQQFQRAATAILNDRPISAYDKDKPSRSSHLSIYSFNETNHQSQDQHYSRGTLQKPPIPKRLSSLERPNSMAPSKTNPAVRNTSVSMKTLPSSLSSSSSSHQADYHPAETITTFDNNCDPHIYSNMKELNNIQQNHNGLYNGNELDCDIYRVPDVPAFDHQSTNGLANGTESTRTMTGTLPRSLLSRNSVSGEIFAYATTTSTLNRRPHRPLSMIVTNNSISEYGMTGARLNGKPVPPVRRTSSISSTTTVSLNSNNPSLNNSLECLPPPSNCLFGESAVCVAETVKSLIDRNHVPASPNALRKTTAIAATHSSQTSVYQSLPNIQHNSSTILKSFQQQQMHQKKTAYAKPAVIQASPIFLRKFTNGGSGILSRSHSVERKSSISSNSSCSSINSNVSADFLASLNSKLASPKPKQPQHQPQQHQPQQYQQQQQKQQQQQLTDDFQNKLKIKYNSDSKINRVRQLINSKIQSDPNTCHESLMDQIKRGARLKKVRITNDRSGPKMF